MKGFNAQLAQGWQQLGPKFLPFADAASAELPLGRLMRLSLFQVSVGMAVVLLTGTLNRVMILELGVPAWLVSLMVALPVVFAPFREAAECLECAETMTHEESQQNLKFRENFQFKGFRQNSA